MIEPAVTDNSGDSAPRGRMRALYDWLTGAPLPQPLASPASAAACRGTNAPNASAEAPPISLASDFLIPRWAPSAAGRIAERRRPASGNDDAWSGMPNIHRHHLPACHTKTIFRLTIGD